MQKFSVAIIGAGIVGAALFSELTRKGVKVVLLEAGADVSVGATKANSGIVHSGYDPKPGSLKAKFNVRGSQIYPAMCARLKVDINQCGTLLVGRESDRDRLQDLLLRGEQNGVQGLRIIERQELHKMEPNLAEEIDLGLFAPTGAVISPYLVCIALCEEGILNGGQVLLNFEVDKIEKTMNSYTIYSQNKSVQADYVINCAGANGNDINALVNIAPQTINYIKGEYLLLDTSQKGFVHRPIFPLPTKISKGILVTPSLHGNIMLGPTAQPCQKEDTTVDEIGIAQIKEKVQLSTLQPNYRKVIKVFAGIRTVMGDDFVIEQSAEAPHFYYALGICSPGLTAAPAIAEYLAMMLEKDGLKTKKIKPIKRQPYVEINKLSKTQLKSLIKQDNRFGKIVCRCEKVTEGEIVSVLNSPLPPKTVDGLKRRIRPTMGRCQGGFCLPKLLKIMSKELHIPAEEIQQNDDGSFILVK